MTAASLLRQRPRGRRLSSRPLYRASPRTRPTRSRRIENGTRSEEYLLTCAQTRQSDVRAGSLIPPIHRRAGYATPPTMSASEISVHNDSSPAYDRHPARRRNRPRASCSRGTDKVAIARRSWLRVSLTRGRHSGMGRAAVEDLGRDHRAVGPSCAFGVCRADATDIAAAQACGAGGCTFRFPFPTCT